MPKNTDAEYQKRNGKPTLRGEIWNAENGIMPGHGAGRAARSAYTKASRYQRVRGEYEYVEAGKGSSRTMKKAQKEAVGVNSGALALIHALNNWDGRARQLKHTDLDGSLLRTEWRGRIREREHFPFEREFLAFSFVKEPMDFVIPELGAFTLKELEVSTIVTPEQSAPSSVLSINDGEYSVGIAQDGSISSGELVTAPMTGISTYIGLTDYPSTSEIARGLDGLLDHYAQAVIAETNR